MRHGAAVVVAWWALLGGAMSATAAETSGESGVSDRAHALVVRMMAATARGESAGPLIQEAGELGMAAALAAAKELDHAPRTQRAPLLELIAVTARCRSWPAELLRHYDPTGHEVFHTDQGLAFEHQVAACLAWDEWEPGAADALVRAAPRPTLAWLEKSASATTGARPQAERMAAVCRSWAAWAQQNRERQHRQALAVASGRLLRSAAMSDAEAAAAVIRLAGVVRATVAEPELSKLALESASADHRRGACAALGRLGDEAALKALVRVLESERDPRVVDAAAAAMDAWPDHAHAGAALLRAFKRVDDAAARRSIAFTTGRGRWPQRAELITLALADADGSVAGAALQALAARPEPTASDAVIALASSFRAAQPNVVDALGALGDPRGSPVLANWLATESNPALRVKLVVALRGIGDVTARGALMDTMQRETSPLVVEQAILAAEVLALDEAVPALLVLAEDRTAPMGPRMQALRALGRFDTPLVRERLEAMLRSGEAWGAASDGPVGTATRPAPPAPAAAKDERVEQARMHIAVAQLRLGEPRAAALVQHAYDHATATNRFQALWMLGSLRIDHPLIARALASDDLALLAAAVRAAGRTRPDRHRPALERLERSPWIGAIADSAMESLEISDRLHEALEAAARPATRP